MVFLYVLASITVFRLSFNSRTFCRNHNRPPNGSTGLVFAHDPDEHKLPFTSMTNIHTLWAHALPQEYRRYNISVIILRSAPLKGAPYNHRDHPPSLFIPLLPEVCQGSLRCCLLRIVAGRLATDSRSDYTIDRARALPLGIIGFRQEKELDIEAVSISPRDLFKFARGGDLAVCMSGRLRRIQKSTRWEHNDDRSEMLCFLGGTSVSPDRSSSGQQLFVDQTRRARGTREALGT